MAKKKKSKKGRAPRRRRGAKVLVILLGLIAAAAAGLLTLKGKAERSIAVAVEGRFASKGAGLGQLDSPRGVAVDLEGNVYVADLGNHRIAKFSRDGKALATFGKKSEQGSRAPLDKFNEPSGVAVDSRGHIWVADAWNGRVVELDARGKGLQEWGGAKYSFYSPRNVAVDRMGNVYVADTGNSRVKAYTPEGKEIKVIGENGKGLGKFKEVFGVAINSKGEIFAADPGNQRIQKFSPLPDAKAVADVKVPGWQRGGPFWPHIAIDSQDRVYAVDNASGKIWVYDAGLKYLGTLGGDKPALTNPLGLAAASDGALYATEMHAGQVVRLGAPQVPASR